MSLTKLIFVITLPILSSCVSLGGRYTVVSTKGATADSFASIESARVKGEACKKTILLVIPISKVDRPEEEAINNALENAKGASFLTDVKITQERLFTFFYNYRCVVAEGTPAIIKR